MKTAITKEQVDLFKSLFSTRTDVYAKFWTNFKTKKSGYAPVYSLNNQTESLDDNALKEHLLGQKIIGVYPLFPDNTCSFLVVDFDKKSWFKDASLVLQTADLLEINVYLERSKSGNGGHVWFFFERRIPAYKARSFGKLLLNKSNLKSSSSYDRLFPSQDEHSGKGFGNLICLPLQGKHLKESNTAFIGQDRNIYSDQWRYLSQMKRVSSEQIEQILSKSDFISTKANSVVSIETTVNSESKNNQAVEDQEEDQPSRKVKTTDSQIVKVTLSNQIFIPDAFLPTNLYKFLKSKLNFANPKFYELERRGYSTWQTPRYLKHIEITPEGILIPIGFLKEIEKFALEQQLQLKAKDDRTLLKTITFSSKLRLRPNQQKIAKNLLKHNRVILEANPGFGKTMIGLYVMKRRKQPTLIIVHTKALLHQWKKRIETWFNFKDEDLGLIGDGKWQVGKNVTIASYQTLARRDIEDLKSQFGLVIVDECHHVPANTLSEVVKQFSAKYSLGLTATAYRRDKLEKLMYFYLSSTIVKATPDANSLKTTEAKIKTKLFTKKTRFILPDNISNNFNEIGKELIQNENRNQVIIRDVVSALEVRAKCLILTERVKHCEILLEQVRKSIKGIHAAIASGRMTKKNRQRIAQRMKQDRFQLLIATGKLIGEGFDWPELTHLFLAYPFSWKGKLVQYVGRVQRQAENKDVAYVYDYLDYEIPMLRAMYFRRLRTYRELKLDKGKVVYSKNNKVNKNQLSLF